MYLAKDWVVIPREAGFSNKQVVQAYRKAGISPMDPQPRNA